MEANQDIVKFAADLQKIVDRPQSHLEEAPLMHVASYTPITQEKQLPAPIKIADPKAYMAQIQV